MVPGLQEANFSLKIEIKRDRKVNPQHVLIVYLEN